MKRARKHKVDPGIAEVRRWRSEVVRQAGGTVRGLMESLRASEARREARARTRAPRGGKRRGRAA